MSRHRSITILAILTTSAGLLLWWFVFRSQSVTSSATTPAPPASTGKKIPPASAETLPTAPPITEPLPTFGSEAFNRLAKERSAAWMAARNRDAGSLLALWDLTGDETLLREAAERFPNNPQVSLAMLCLLEEKDSSETEKQQWTDQMITNDPDNPIGYYFRAKLALDRSDKAGVFAAVDSALAAEGKLNFYLRERILNTRDSLVSNSMPLLNNYLHSDLSVLIRSSKAMKLTGHLIPLYREELAAFKKAQQTDEHQRLAAVGLKISDQLKTAESKPLVPLMLSASMRILYLEELDSSTIIANTGRNAGMELAIAKSEGESLEIIAGGAQPAYEWLRSAPMEVQAQYADRMLEDGEMPAVKYLLNQMPKP